jgi:pimeloyl-ACP methyl ester carboxylesterase
MPRFDHAEAARASRATVFGDYRIVRQSEACEHWPQGKVSADFFAPIQSAVPVLFISGERDPVTPVSWAEQASRGFANGRLLTMPWSAHVFDGLSGIDTCFDPLVLRFFETADARSLDATCLAAMSPPPVVVADSAEPAH